MPEKLSEAEFVVIGGGAIGCCVAYSLAATGRTDVLLLERAEELGEITTSQGAGLCGQVRSTVDRVQLAMHSVRTFNQLKNDATAPLDWRQVGSLRIALSDAAVQMFHQLSGIATEAGLEVELLDPAAAARRWPPMDFAGVQAVLWCPSDGYLDPQTVVRAYEYQARQLGARFATAVQVEGIQCRNGRVEAVQTDLGTIPCRMAINAAGAHAYHIARLAGLELPIVPVRHEYFVSVPMAGLEPTLPCFRVPDLSLYGRAAEDCLLLGGWEASSQAADPRQFELKGPAPDIEPDLQVLDNFARRFARLVPAAANLAKARIAKGWPTFTPDGRFILGESSEVRGFVMAGGCNAHGISGSPGIGRLLLESLFDPDPSEYVRSLSPDRFAVQRWDWQTARQQAQQVYETYYTVEAC